MFLKAFGREAGFFTGWAYWVVSWTSNIAVIIAAVSYLSPILGHTSTITNLLLEILLFLIFTLVNIRGASLAGSLEMLLTILKCLPLVVIPIGGLFFF
ncbi:MAG UNVERIFIED_CONTAM: amino acid permease [Rickettsiaceae bacterium]|jgi:APA family basic amino acid/polyamine antiporter